MEQIILGHEETHPGTPSSPVYFPHTISLVVLASRYFPMAWVKRAIDR
jgi:hypothetical protein